MRETSAGVTVSKPGRPSVFARHASILVVLFAAVAPCAAQTDTTTRAKQAPSKQEQADERPRWEFRWAGGLHFLGPVRTSLAFGGGLRRDESEVSDRSRYVFGFLEPGFGGARLSAGYAESINAPASGWSVRASLLKLTSEPARRTLLGLEVQGIVLLCVGSRVGAFRPVAPAGDHHVVWLADVSLCL